MKKLFLMLGLVLAIATGAKAAGVVGTTLGDDDAFPLDATWYTLTQTWNGTTYYWFYDENRPLEMRLAEQENDGTELFRFCFVQNTDGSTYTVYNRYLGASYKLAALSDGTVGFVPADSLDATATSWTVVDNTATGGAITLQNAGKGIYCNNRVLSVGEDGAADAAYAITANVWVRPSYRIHSAAGSYMVDRTLSGGGGNLGLSTEESDATIFKVERNNDGTYMVYVDSATIDGVWQALDPIHVLVSGNPCTTKSGASGAARLRLVSSVGFPGAIAMQMRNFDNNTWYIYDYRTSNGTTNIWSSSEASGGNVAWYFTDTRTGQNMTLPTVRYNIAGTYNYVGKGVIDGEEVKWNTTATIDYDTKSATVKGLTPGTVDYTLTGTYNAINCTVTIPANTELDENTTISALNETTRENGDIVLHFSTSGRTIEIYDAIEVTGNINEMVQGHNVDSLVTNQDNPVLYEQGFNAFDVTLYLNKVVNSSVNPYKKYYNVKTRFVVNEDGTATVTGLLPEFEGKTFTGGFSPDQNAIYIDYGPVAVSDPASEGDTLGLVSYQYTSYRGISAGWKGRLYIYFNGTNTRAYTPRALIVYDHPDPNGSRLTNAGLKYWYDNLNDSYTSTPDDPIVWTDTAYVVPRLNQRADTVPRQAWQVTVRDWDGNDAAGNMIDEDASTIWHSNYPGSSNGHGTAIESLPECFTIDLGQSYTMGGFGYMSRPYNNGHENNGAVYGYRLYVSDTPYDITAEGFDMANPGGTLAAQGNLQERYALTTSAAILDENFTQTTTGRYVLFVFDGGYGDKYASCAEFYLYTGMYNGIGRIDVAGFGDAVRTDYYTTDGLPATKSTRGILIVKKTYENGQTVVSKVLNK